MKRGYERIAFGSVKDAVRLLFCEEPTAQLLGRMDLFSIAEIKRPRGGGMEIKFFDRMRAMQALAELPDEEGEELSGLVRALEEGARALGEEGP